MVLSVKLIYKLDPKYNQGTSENSMKRADTAVRSGSEKNGKDIQRNQLLLLQQTPWVCLI